MEKLKALLLPLALVFAAIAIFEFGARYGASNTRAVALTTQLNNYTNLYQQVADKANAPSRANLEAIIDNYIATAALQRGAWYLMFKDEPKLSLEKSLAYALSVRGDATIERFKALKNDPNSTEVQISSERLDKVISALEKAQAELIQESAESMPETPPVDSTAIEEEDVGF